MVLIAFASEVARVPMLAASFGALVVEPVVGCKSGTTACAIKPMASTSTLIATVLAIESAAAWWAPKLVLPAAPALITAAVMAPVLAVSAS